MKTNVGSIDRLVRILLGIVLLALIFVVEGNARWLGLVGLVPLITAFIGWCPAYALIGASTCPARE